MIDQEQWPAYLASSLRYSAMFAWDAKVQAETNQLGEILYPGLQEDSRARAGVREAVAHRTSLAPFIRAEWEKVSASLRESYPEALGMALQGCDD